MARVEEIAIEGVGFVAPASRWRFSCASAKVKFAGKMPALQTVRSWQRATESRSTAKDLCRAQSAAADAPTAERRNPCKWLDGAKVVCRVRRGGPLRRKPGGAAVRAALLRLLAESDLGHADGQESVRQDCDRAGGIHGGG